MKRMVGLIMIFTFCVGILAGCKDNGEESSSSSTEPVLKEIEELNYDSTGLSNVLYQNPGINFGTAPIMGDPFLHYEESEKTFYLYGTTGGSRFDYYVSKDLVDWSLGGTCFQPTSSDWSQNRLWAPEMHKIGDKYYLYYSAAENSSATLHCSVAVSDSPKGPFTNNIAEGVDGSKPRFDFGFASIDGSVFVDDDGKMYYYFAKDQVDGISTIWGAELENPYTLKGPAKQLTRVGYSKTTGNETQPWETAQGRWNEGPYMVKHGDIYYLTYSANMYTSKYYGVGYATSFSPLDDFEKPADCMLMGSEKLANSADEWDYASGTGHHMFITLGNQTYVVYHKQYNIINKGNVRIFAYDSFGFREDGTMYINGSTISPQPLPEVLSGYQNVASRATISCSDIDASQKNLLKDGSIGVYSKNNELTDVLFGAGKTTITLRFKEPTKVKSIMIYNGSEYSYLLKTIDKIQFDEAYYITNLKLNGNYIDTIRKYMAVGNAMYANLYEDIEVTQIKIDINVDYEFSLSEIVVLGK